LGFAANHGRDPRTFDREAGKVIRGWMILVKCFDISWFVERPIPANLAKDKLNYTDAETIPVRSGRPVHRDHGRSFL